jgi:hypothetical protein
LDEGGIISPVSWRVGDGFILPSFSTLARQILKNGSDLLFEKFGIISWLLWHTHNQKRLHLPSEEYVSIWPRAQTLLKDYLAVHDEKPAKQKPAPAKWKPPAFNSFKANFDGAFSKESNAGGIGVVIRDKQGLVIATLSQKVHVCHSAEMIEALAAKRAVHFAIEVGLTDVEFEGDAETLIRDLNHLRPSTMPMVSFLMT